MKNHFTIIAIGCSAGGLNALEQMLPLIPTNINAAIVLVPHLLAAHESKLDEVISRYTALRVIRVSDGLALAPKTVFILPEDQMMTLSEGHLRLRHRLADEVVNQAIDIFFCSLAAEVGKGAIGVILSGAGKDGLTGSEAIKARGGTVIVQNPCSADFTGMPEYVIAKDDPDYILLPDAIVNKLVEKAGCNDVPA